MTHLVQRPPRIAGNGKVVVQGEVHDILLCRPRVRPGLDLAQTLAHEPDAVYQQPVGGALDLKVAEEGIGAEEGEDLVEDVVALVIGVGRLVGRQR